MDETHELLLAIAGRVDDDLLAWARELVAVGEDTRAVELVTAGLSADRVALPAAVRAAAVAAATTARIDLDADAALAPATSDETETEHRFTAGHDDERLTAAVGALPERLVDGARVELTWRVTPAGAAPGPLPHPVLLVEIEPGGRPADVLAYQLHVALDRAGVIASVEVLTTGHPVPAYHLAARDAARSVDDGAEFVDPVRLPVPADAPALREEPADQVSRAVPLRPATDGGGRRRRAAPEPAPGPAPRAGEQHRPTVTPISRPLPSPVPLRRASGPSRPLAPVEAPVERTDEQQAVRPAAEVPALAETPTYRSMQDPLSGPLHTPLLATQLDPTPDGEQYDDDYDDEYDQGPVAGPGVAPGGEQYDSAAFGVSPLAPEGEAPAEDGWAGEWASGDWAVASTDLDDEPEDVPAAPEPAPAPAPVSSARHRFAGPPQPPLHQPPPPPPPAPVPLPQRPAPEPQPEPHRPDLGLRPDSLARLSDADRELLARLQAELGAAGRKPRITRRAGVVPNGNGRPPNG
jgi:hypothetical protein